MTRSAPAAGALRLPFRSMNQNSGTTHFARSVMRLLRPSIRTVQAPAFQSVTQKRCRKLFAPAITGMRFSSEYRRNLFEAATAR